MALVLERVLDSGFDFIVDGGTPIRDNEPNLTTFGSVCHFKTKNGAHIVRNQNFEHTDITVLDTFGGTGSFTFTTIHSLWVKLIELKFFNGITGDSGSGGSTTFSGLNDTEAYFGNNGKIPIVNESEMKLDYTTFYNINKFVNLEDVEVTSLIDGKIVGVALIGGVPKITLVDKPVDGDIYFSAVGGFDYNDLATQATPLSYMSGDLQLTNDSEGDYTFLSQPPYGITNVWDEESNTFDWSELSIGDEVFLRVHINITTTGSNQVSGLKILFGEGTDNEYYQPIDLGIAFKTAGSYDILRDLKFYIGNNDWKNTPCKILFNSDANASVTVNGWHPYIIRKSINVLDVEVKGGSEKPNYITATDGQTEFSIDESVDNVDVYVNRLYQIESVDYNRVLGTITFQSSLDDGDIVNYRTFTTETSKESVLAAQDQTEIELSNTPRTIDVWVNRLQQIEGIDYNKSGNIVTFTSLLDENDYIIIRKYR